MNFTHLFKCSIFIFSLILGFSSSYADESIPEKPVETSLQMLDYQGERIFALTYRNVPHWHTYWKNPGDAGLPTKITPKNFEIEELPWPVPERFIEKGDILAYGYGGEYTRFFKAKNIPEDNFLKLSSNWLVCKHICIPGKVDIEAKIEGDVLNLTTSKDFIVPAENLIKRIKLLPENAPWPQSLDMVLKKGSKENQIVIYYNSPNPGHKALPLKLGLITPYGKNLLDLGREKLYKNDNGTLFGKMNVGWDGEYMEPEVPFPDDGVFQEPITLKFLWQNPLDGEVKIIEKEFSSFDITGADAIESLMGRMTFLPPKSSTEVPESGTTKGEETQSPQEAPMDLPPQSSLITILLFAFLGGLILNIMPCVLPVISLKLFGLVVHSDESRASILKHNIFYTLGVLFTFLLLSIAVIFIKSTGENIGWGFQLQSPIFVSFMVIILFIFALNLFGLFEFQTPGGRILGNVQLKRGVLGDFFGGVLATILSTPCSAPFLGTALTFAFAASMAEILVTFQAIGLGLAFPFLMTGFFPKTIKFLPKPGLWMENVKKFLGFTLILTALWLLDVFVSLTDGNLPLMKLNTGLALLFFAFYFQKHISRKMAWRILFFGSALAIFASLYTGRLESNQKDRRLSGQSDLIREKNLSSDVMWETWSEAKMKEYQEQGETVFIDFTAKWCFTCKVNEKLVLDTNSFTELVKDKNMKLLLADWTKYDPVIGAFLKKHGYVGVPVYFIQKPDGSLVKLGETITLGKIKKNL